MFTQKIQTLHAILARLKSTRAAHKEAGFTLVEVMVVMVIIGLLTTFVVLNIAPARDTASVTKAQADIRIIEQALELYRLDMLDYPPQSAGLSALRIVPNGIINAERYRKGGYVKSLPKDPWQRDYLYRYPGQYGTYDVFSYGADGEEGGEGIAGDIVNWAQ